MSGLDCIFDTNALIYIMNGNPCMKPYLNKNVGVSVITEIELLSFPDIQKEEEQVIAKLLSNCTIFPIGISEKEKTIELRRKYRMKLPDALIAALAVVHGLPLVTADKGFQKVEELQISLLDPGEPK